MNNIFYFDRDNAQGFHVTRGCDYSCGLDSNKVFAFQGNLYWRTDGGFASDPKAFHVMKGSIPNPDRCSGSMNLEQASALLSFQQWQGDFPLNAG